MTNPKTYNHTTEMVTTECPECRHLHEFQVPREGWETWKGGVLIQKALPTLTSDQREMLISGICPPCWERLFVEERSLPDPDDLPPEAYDPNDDLQGHPR